MHGLQNSSCSISDPPAPSKCSVFFCCLLSSASNHRFSRAAFHQKPSPRWILIFCLLARKTDQKWFKSACLGFKKINSYFSWYNGWYCKFWIRNNKWKKKIYFWRNCWRPVFTLLWNEYNDRYKLEIVPSLLSTLQFLGPTDKLGLLDTPLILYLWSSSRFRMLARPLAPSGLRCLRSSSQPRSPSLDTTCFFLVLWFFGLILSSEKPIFVLTLIFFWL